MCAWSTAVGWQLVWKLETRERYTVSVAFGIPWEIGWGNESIEKRKSHYQLFIGFHGIHTHQLDVGVYRTHPSELPPPRFIWDAEPQVDFFSCVRDDRETRVSCHKPICQGLGFKAVRGVFSGRRLVCLPLFCCQAFTIAI